MKKNRKQTWLSLLKTMVTIACVSRFFHNFITLVMREARLAKKSVAVLCILFLIGGVFFAAAWFSLMAMIYFYCVTLGFALISALAIIAGLNVILMLLAVFFAYKLKENPCFPESTRIINQLFSMLKD